MPTKIRNMFNWLFKKEKDTEILNKFEEMEKSLKRSFSNIKEDINNLSEHSKHFHSKHFTHDQKFQGLHERILLLEELIKKHHESKEELNEIKDELELDELGRLTQVSQRICMVLAALSKEDPDRLIQLKTLAEEMYPNKKYQEIRSTVSQYTTELEELGYLVKKKKGRQVFIKSTEKNPYLNKKATKKIKLKSKV